MWLYNTSARFAMRRSIRSTRSLLCSFVYQMCGKAEWINGLLLTVPAFLKTVLAFPVAYLADTGSKERLIKAGTWIGITSVVMTIAGLYLMANITPWTFRADSLASRLGLDSAC